MNVCSNSMVSSLSALSAGQVLQLSFFLLWFLLGSSFFSPVLQAGVPPSSHWATKTPTLASVAGFHSESRQWAPCTKGHQGPCFGFKRLRQGTWKRVMYFVFHVLPTSISIYIHLHLIFRKSYVTSRLLCNSCKDATRKHMTHDYL